MTRILVVDDEPALRRTLERALCSLKYDVVAIGDAHLAYQMLDAGEYDLVLLDIHLRRCRATPSSSRWSAAGPGWRDGSSS